MTLSLDTNGGFVSGRKTVTTAGTPVQLVPPDTGWSTDIWISALAANTKPITWGGEDTVDGPVVNRAGAVVPASGEPPLHLEIDDPSKIWIDAEVNGEGVSFTYKQP